MLPLLEPTPVGIALAAALVVAGAPLFSAGLRVLRLRRHLTRLSERPLAELPTGFVLVRGRVTLDSPLVAPISGKPCAGFRLEVRGAGVSAAVEERRVFRLAADDVTARVFGADGSWDMAVAAERTYAPGEALSENLSALLDRSSGAAWIRRSRSPFTVVERSLVVSHECFVIGQARQARPFELPAEAETLKTGTDDVAVAATGSRFWSSEPDLWIGTDGHLDFLRVSDRAPEPGALIPPAWKAFGVMVGPSLSLFGLLYLASAADRLRAAGGH